MSHRPRFIGQRPLRITLRTGHLAGMSLFLGATYYGQDPGWWVILMLLTGCGLVAEDLYRNGEDYFRYAQSWAIIAKICLFFGALYWPEHALAFLGLAFVVGSVISHAPGAVRQFPLWGAPGPCATRSCKHGPTEKA